MPGTWVGRTAGRIADAVRGGGTTAVEVVADHLEYIAANDGELHAFRTVLAEDAVAEARGVDARTDRTASLLGVPVAVKENTALRKLEWMFPQGKADAQRLAAQKAGEFHLVAEGSAVRQVRVQPNLVPALQVPDEQILTLARR